MRLNYISNMLMFYHAQNTFVYWCKHDFHWISNATNGFDQNNENWFGNQSYDFQILWKYLLVFCSFSSICFSLILPIMIKRNPQIRKANWTFNDLSSYSYYGWLKKLLLIKIHLIIISYVCFKEIFKIFFLELMKP